MAREKKRDLAIIERSVPDWGRQILVAMAQTKYLDASHVVDFVGFRPAELTHGVTVERYDENSFSLHVVGAKVRDDAGQPWRRVVVSDDRLPTAWADRLRLNRSFIIKIESAKAFSESMSRISKRLFPRLPRVTPYCFRHAVPEAMRDEGRTAEEIAAVMGHRVPETQAAYGRRSGGGKRRRPDRRAPMGAQIARPVRALNRSGLDAVRKKGKAKKNSTNP
jgi:hypothetical protein